jgi:hypothetical protein
MEIMSRGQLIAELDDAVIKRTLEEMEGQLAVATDFIIVKNPFGSKTSVLKCNTSRRAKESLKVRSHFEGEYGQH